MAQSRRSTILRVFVFLPIFEIHHAGTVYPTNVTVQRRGFCGGTDVSKQACCWRTYDEIANSIYHLGSLGIFWPSQKPPKTNIRPSRESSHYSTELTINPSTTSGLSRVHVTMRGTRKTNQHYTSLDNISDLLRPALANTSSKSRGARMVELVTDCCSIFLFCVPWQNILMSKRYKVAKV